MGVADDDVVGIVRDIAEKYTRINGGIPRKHALILLAPFRKQQTPRVGARRRAAGRSSFSRDVRHRKPPDSRA
jgi:hypothetical protein